MWYFIAALAGFYAGIFLMCLLQMARTEDELQTDVRKVLRT